MWSSLCGTVDEREEASCTVPRVLLPHRNSFLRLLFEVIFYCCVQYEVYCNSDGVCGIVDGYSNMERSKHFDRFALCLRHAASATWRFLYYFSLSGVRSRSLSSRSCSFFRGVKLNVNVVSFLVEENLLSLSAVCALPASKSPALCHMLRVLPGAHAEVHVSPPAPRATSPAVRSTDLHACGGVPRVRAHHGERVEALFLPFMFIYI